MFKKIINLAVNIAFTGILIGIGYYYLYLYKTDSSSDSFILDLQNYSIIPIHHHKLLIFQLIKRIQVHINLYLNLITDIIIIN